MPAAIPKKATGKATEASHERGKARLRKASELVGELGKVEKELAVLRLEFMTKVGTRPSRAMQLEAQILALYEDAQADMPFVAESGGFVGTISARCNETVADKQKAYKLLGRDKYIGLSTVALGVLRKELDGPAQAECLTTTRTGARTLTVIEKAA